MTKKKVETGGAKPSNAARISAVVVFLGALAGAILNWANIRDRFLPGEIDVTLGRAVYNERAIILPMTNEGARPVTIENVVMTVTTSGGSVRGADVFTSPSVLEGGKGADVVITAQSAGRPVNFPSSDGGECSLSFQIELRSGKRKATLDTSCSCAAVAQPPASKRKTLTFFAYQGVATPAAFASVAGLVRRKVVLETRGLIDLGDLRPETREDPLPALAQRTVIWSDTGSLLLAGGQVTGSGDNAVLLNEVFLGSLAGELPNPLFIDVPASALSLRQQKDALSAITLYAVAMDRMERGDRSPATRQLFARARTMALGAQNEADESRAILEAIDHQLGSFQ